MAQPVVKSQQAKISIYNGQAEFLFGYTNQKATRFAFASSRRFFAAKLTFEEGSNNYYGSSMLVLFDCVQKRSQVVVQDYLNTYCIFRPQNAAGTEVLVTSSGNPCKLQFTYITYQKASDSLIIKPTEYKHKVFINASFADSNVLVLRGEAGMDGQLYVCIYQNNQVKVVSKINQRDLTHVNATSSCLLFSTQRPRFQVDNSYYLNDFSLTK